MLKGVFISIVFVVLSGSTFNPETESFDVAIDDIVILHSGELTTLTYINCRFSIDSVLTAPDRLAFVAIEFTSTDPKVYDRDAYMARIAAYRSEDVEGWRHEFTLTDPENRDSVIVAYKGATESALSMSLSGGWETGEFENKVFFSVGDMDASMVDVSSYPLVSWQVVATGVKGDSSCLSSS